MDNEAEKLMAKATARVVIDEPFFASILLRQNRMEDTSCDTAWVDGESLGYNPDFIKSLDPSELKGLLLHEVMHLVYMHHLRRGDREHRQWNVAGDHVINLGLHEGGYILPNGGLMDPQYKDMYTEEVYGKLPPCPPGGNGNGKMPGWGEVRDKKAKGKKLTGAALKDAINQTKVLINQAHNAAKARGNVPAGVDRMVKDMNDSKLPWRQILSRFVGEKAKNDYSWSYPNRRYLPQGIILPGLDSEGFGKIILANDTSASISEKQLKEIASEAVGCLAMYDEEGIDVKLTCLWCDTKVHVQYIGVGDTPVPQGGGGTDFVPVFDWIDENEVKPQALIYCTDGHCHSFPDKPAYDVLWGVIGKHDFKPPFGEVMHVQD